MIKKALKLFGISVFLASFIASIWLNYWFFGYMSWLQTAHILLRLDRLSGDIELRVPYSADPYKFHEVCRPEQIL